MADELKELIRSERLSLIELLETLTPAQWSTPSLCTGWTVRDVAAHIAWAPVLPPRAMLGGLARSGFRPNRFNADSARRWSARGTAAILEQLRANAAGDAKPIGLPRVAALLDAVVHGLDIRRPLCLPRPVPTAAFTPVADFSANTRWPASTMVGGSIRRRIAGLRLVADDADWSHGTGPEVHAAKDTLLLVLNGRPVAREELTGAGADTLHARISREHRRTRAGSPPPPGQ